MINEAARLVAGQADAETRALLVDRLLDDPATLAALRAALPLQAAATQLADRVVRARAPRRWLGLDGWSWAGMLGAGAAAALMLLAPMAPLQHEALPLTPQRLVVDVVHDGSFEPNGALFGGDFEPRAELFGGDFEG